jgi:magnesium transporter
MNTLNETKHQLIKTFSIAHMGELILLLETSNASEAAMLFNKLNPKVAADCLSKLLPDQGQMIISKLTSSKISELANLMSPTVLSSILSLFSKEEKIQKMGLLASELQKELADIMSYPKESIGSVMDVRPLMLKANHTIHHALAKLRVLNNSQINQLYIVDDFQKLLGCISIQQLAISSSKVLLGSVMQPVPAKVHVMDPQDIVSKVLEMSHYPSIPVLDAEERLVGVIRYDVLIKVVQEELTADIQAMVGVSSDEKALSKVGFSVKKRFPWLLINLATTFLAASVVGLFESTIAQFTALAVLLPVVAGQSGNTGAQALAVISRGLALKEIRVSHALRVVLKEGAVGFYNGVLISVVCALGVFLWSQSLGLATVIGCAMIIAMVTAGLSGAMVPIILTIIKQDPAAASSIVVTTITDVVGFLSFLGLASLFSQYLS